MLKKKTYFAISIILLILASILEAAVSIGQVNLNLGRLDLLFVIASYSFILIGLIEHRIFKSTSFSRMDNLLLIALNFWFFICILKSSPIMIGNLKATPRFLGGRLYTAALLVPFFVYWGSNLDILNTTWQLAKKFVFLFMLCIPLVIMGLPEFYLFEFIAFMPLLFLSKDKLSKRDNLFVLIVFVAVVIFVVIIGARHLFVKFAYYFVVAALIGSRNKFTSNLKFRIAGVLYIIAFLTLFVFVYSGKVSKYFTNERIVHNIKKYEKDNFNSESRDLVYVDFAEDFSNWRDLLFGRGPLGTTFSPQFIIIQENLKIVENVFNAPKGHRFEIEAGYLQFILKSGLIGLTLFLIIAIRAVYLGLFRSQNNFTHACAFIVFERLLSMLPFGLPAYSLDYILVWLCIGACLSSKIRNLTSVEMFLNFTMLRGKQYRALVLASGLLPKVWNKRTLQDNE